MTPSLFSVRGKRIAITGAAGHLGATLATTLANEGAHVFLIDRDEQTLAELCATVSEKSPGSVTPYVGDLEESSARDRISNELLLATPELNGLVHASAFVGTSDLAGWAVGFQDQSIETWRRALEVNVTAPFHLTQLLFPLLKKSADSSIVMIGSIHGIVGPDWSLYEGLDMANPAAYAVSKAALIQLTTWLATTLAPTVRCNTVSPGGLERSQPGEFVKRYSERTPMARMGTERDVVGAIMYLLSDASSYVTGQNILVDGGYTAW